nr:HepT-like ribonuclease domain-containing protein [Ectothiorhodospira haloalkaliphila]
MARGRPRERCLAHITEAIEHIDRHIGDMDKMAFLSNQLVQDAVIRNLEIVGEASNNIEKHHHEFAASHPELPLSFAYQMRNAIAHGYFKVGFEIVWNTIHREWTSTLSEPLNA